MYRYPAEFERDDNDTYLVRFPDIPEAITFGEDVEDALRHAGEALEAAFIHLHGSTPGYSQSQPTKRQKDVSSKPSSAKRREGRTLHGSAVGRLEKGRSRSPPGVAEIPGRPAPRSQSSLSSRPSRRGFRGPWQTDIDQGSGCRLAPPSPLFSRQNCKVGPLCPPREGLRRAWSRNRMGQCESRACPVCSRFCQGRSKFGPLRRSKSRPVGEGVAVFVGRLERSLRSPFRAAQA